MTELSDQQKQLLQIVRKKGWGHPDLVEGLLGEIAELRADVELWKDRHAAAEQALGSTIRDCEDLLNDRRNRY